MSSGYNENRGEELAIREYEADRAERRMRWSAEETKNDDPWDTHFETLEDELFGSEVAMTVEMADVVWLRRLQLENQEFW